MNNFELENIGVVVIGRNEGDRLVRCLNSVLVKTPKLIYVDSGSADKSIWNAKSNGVPVHVLSNTKKFTAARARNAGFREILKLYRGIELIQFIDGDVELDNAWLENSLYEFNKKCNTGIVCGQLTEKHPEQSIYNRLCEIEWSQPPGIVLECGGIFVIRKDIFEQVGGFVETLIGGEEPELCQRVRATGYNIIRLEYSMGLHDANIQYFHQWWKRNIRTGHAFTELIFIHGITANKYWVKSNLSILFWGGVAPLLALFGALINEYMLVIALIYPVQIIKIAMNQRNRIHNIWLYAFFTMVDKIPQFIGQLKYLIRRIFNRERTLIEYK